MADLTQQLTSEKSKVKELDNHLETQRDITRGLQEQISLLEQRIQSEEARSKEFKVCCIINVSVPPPETITGNGILYDGVPLLNLHNNGNVY